jgi:general secretion pathway protein G
VVRRKSVSSFKFQVSRVEARNLKPATRTRARGQLGFTLVELMIVISILLILISVAVPNYRQAIVRSKEAVLRQNLDTLRKTIDAYTYDKRKAPQSLDDLVSAGYLKKIPNDPITNQADWEVVSEDTMASIDQTEPGINDVHSASQQPSTEGTAYNTW